MKLVHVISLALHANVRLTLKEYIENPQFSALIPQLIPQFFSNTTQFLLKELIKKNPLLETEVSDAIFLIYEKISKEQELHDQEVELLQEEISKIQDKDLHDLMVKLFDELKGTIYKKYEEEIKIYKADLRKSLLKGEKPIKSVSRNYDELLSVLTMDVKTFQYRNNKINQAPNVGLKTDDVLSLVENLKKISGIEVHETVFLVCQKLIQEMELLEEDIKSLHKELSMIPDNDLHDLIIEVLQKLETDNYKKYEEEIKQNKKLIKKYLVSGEKLPKFVDNKNYYGLINLLKTHFFELNYRNKEFDKRRYDEKSHNIQKIVLGVNCFILLGKLPVTYLNNLTYPTQLKKIQDELNTTQDKENKNPVFIFSRQKFKYTTNASDHTYLATDGKKIFYATPFSDDYLFVASHQYNKKSAQFFENSFKIETNLDRPGYHRSNQVFWIEFSNQVMAKTSKLFCKPKYRNLEATLHLLGKKRQIAAQALEHRRDEKRTGDFGRPRGKHDLNICEVISSKNHIMMGGKVYPLISKRLNALQENPQFTITNNILHLKNEIDPDDCSKFRIRFENYPYDAVFLYPDKDNDDFSRICQKLQPLFENLLNWNGEDINEFIKNLGRLSYALYRDLPFSLGTSAIVEWLVRSIASYKGVELGAFQNNEADLPLDWEAFLTFDREAYANWYLAHAYKEFHFKKESNLSEDTATTNTFLI